MEERFLTNYSEINFIDQIRDSLKKCNGFSFSVSFIKKAGLILIQREIEFALERGINGRIITLTYQNFTDIGSLRILGI
jgi:HKD family nuclease